MRIRSGTPILYVSLTVAAVVTLGLAGTFLFLMWHQGRATVGFTLFIAPFLLMGLLLGFFGARGLLRLALHGSWQIELADEGGRLGAPLRVLLLPRQTVMPNGDLQCRLRCVRSIRTRVRSGHGTGGSDRHDSLWETSWSVRAGTIHPRSGYELTLPFPADGHPTVTDERSGSAIQWQLNVLVPTARHTHEAMFDIPVRA